MPLWTNVDFSLAVTRALLLLDWGVAWDAPRDRLVPPVPGRLNYLLWIEDLLAARAAAVWPAHSQKRVLGIDIGTGASCIFPVLGHAACGWDFVGTELDPSSLAWAARIVEANSLEHHITLARACADRGIIAGVVRDLLARTRVSSASASADGVATASPAPAHVASNDPTITAEAVQSCWDSTVGRATSVPGADFSMCNPPFFGTWEEATASMAAAAHKTVCTGTRAEMVTVGGETAFVERMARESAHGDTRGAVTWYTTMLGKHESVPLVRQMLRDLGVPTVRTTTFRQGSTSRWGVAWSWLPPCAFLDEAWSFLAADGDSGLTATAAADRSTCGSHNSESPAAPPALLPVGARGSSTANLSGMIDAGYSGIGGEIDSGLPSQPIAGHDNASAIGSEYRDCEVRCQCQAVSNSEVHVYASAVTARGTGTMVTKSTTDSGLKLSARTDASAGCQCRPPHAALTGAAAGATASATASGSLSGRSIHWHRDSRARAEPVPLPLAMPVPVAPASPNSDSEVGVSAAVSAPVEGSALAHWRWQATAAAVPVAAPSGGSTLRLTQAREDVPQQAGRRRLISGLAESAPGSACDCLVPASSSSPVPLQVPTILMFPIILTPAAKCPALQAMTVKVGRRRLYASTLCAAQRCTEAPRLPYGPGLQRTVAVPLADAQPEALGAGATRATGKRAHNRDDRESALPGSEGGNLSDRGATPPRLPIEIVASRIEEFLHSPPPVASDPSSAILSFQAPTHCVTFSPSHEKVRCVRAWRGGVLGTVSEAHCATVAGAAASDSTAAVPKPSATPSLLAVRFLYEVQLFAEVPGVDGAACIRGQLSMEGPAGRGSSSADVTQEQEGGGSVAVCLLAAQDPASRVAFDRFARALERDTLRVSRKWRRRAQGAT